MTQASTTSVGLGMPNLCRAMVPGHIDVQAKDELRQNLLTVTLDQVVAGLTRQPQAATAEAKILPRTTVFTGSFDEVNAHFYEHEWSEGLPVVPPTIARVEAFLRFTDRKPDEVLGILLPDSRAATVWSVAVNGVMAGCRPEYMPILVALVQAMSDPEYGNEHSSNTPGAETLIMLNGPLIKQLGFNYEQGVMRDGFQANTSIGRFWRLYLRNIAGFLPHKTDKGTYGNTWRVVIAENEDALAEIGWQPNSVDMGFKPGENVVTIGRYTGGNLFAGVGGSTPEEMLPYIADAVLRQISWHVIFTMGHGERDAASAPADHADSRAADREGRMVEGRRQALPLRTHADAGVSVQPVPELRRLGESRSVEHRGSRAPAQSAGDLPGVRRPEPPRADRLWPGRFHDLRDGGSAADQCIRVRAEWPPRFPGGPPGRAA